MQEDQSFERYSERDAAPVYIPMSELVLSLFPSDDEIQLDALRWKDKTKPLGRAGSECCVKSLSSTFPIFLHTRVAKNDSTR